MIKIVEMVSFVCIRISPCGITIVEGHHKTTPLIKYKIRYIRKDELGLKIVRKNYVFF